MSAFLVSPFTKTALKGSRIYVVKFDNGTVKVGRSLTIDSRLHEHEKHGATRAWVSGLVDTPNLVESWITGVLSAEATARVGREYFKAVTFERALEVAQAEIARSVNTAGSTDRMTGRRVKEQIARSGMTVALVAARSGLSHVSLHRKIRGERSFSVSELGSVSQALGVSIVDLVALQEEEAA